MNPTHAERMKLALKIATEMLPQLTWRRLPDEQLPPELKGVAGRAFEGVAPGAFCTCASFSIENQGFPVGSRGYDGAITVGNPPTILHLTRELAQQAVELAEAAQPKA